LDLGIEDRQMHCSGDAVSQFALRLQQIADIAAQAVGPDDLIGSLGAVGARLHSGRGDAAGHHPRPLHRRFRPIPVRMPPLTGVTIGCG
ncbi:hypothetical protein, partial [Bradyrhizobium sp. NBAIM03]|uniref:hypothetical protein n=1 Tax=Bradyrhizobium sp. NBAIM03 TaxID=2793816 RepID=UPI001CD26BAD